jgi:hypothetical protein
MQARRGAIRPALAVTMAGIVIAALAVPTFAAEVWGSIVRVNDDATNTSQVLPDVGVGPSGAAIAVWQDYRASPPADPFAQIDIFSSRWDPGTGAWSANVRVNDAVAGQQFKPAVAVDGSDNAFAVWVDRRNGRSDIFASKRSASSGTWGSNVRVNSTTKFDTQDSPAIAVAPNGDAIALWYRAANHKSNIWASRLPAGSSTWGPEIRVTSNQTTQKQGPRVAVGPNGTAYAAWMDPAVGNADIWFSSLAAGSSTWSTNTKISDDPGSAFQGPTDIGVDGAGNVFVAWTDRRTSPYQLRVRRLPSGGSWAASTVIASDGGNAPSIAVRTDGRAFVVWHDGDAYEEYPRVWGSAYDAGAWSAPERIDASDPGHSASSAAVAIDATKVIVVWKDAVPVDSGVNNDDILSRVGTP